MLARASVLSFFITLSLTSSPGTIGLSALVGGGGTVHVVLDVSGYFQ